ncbi:Uncharacterised protein [Raoultella planticola]|uniref:Uncharacterized protein n=1 Tax=Raoultella planticola TaxID=575 RepID=A0A485BFY4_RAOPL|nr:Uncharacterised protein [Raoultella planticola]
MIDFEQHKNIVEEFVEQHYPLAHSLMADSYKDAEILLFKLPNSHAGNEYTP